MCVCVHVYTYYENNNYTYFNFSIDNMIQFDEFDFLLGKRNSETLEKCNLTHVNNIQLPQKSWENICYLDSLPSFNGELYYLNTVLRCSYVK